MLIFPFNRLVNEFITACLITIVNCCGCSLLQGLETGARCFFYWCRAAIVTGFCFIGCLLAGTQHR